MLSRVSGKRTTKILNVDLLPSRVRLFCLQFSPTSRSSLGIAILTVRPMHCIGSAGARCTKLWSQGWVRVPLSSFSLKFPYFPLTFPHFVWPSDRRVIHPAPGPGYATVIRSATGVYIGWLTWLMHESLVADPYPLWMSSNSG